MFSSATLYLTYGSVAQPDQGADQLLDELVRRRFTGADADSAGARTAF
jgi:hypothetical protein